MHDLFIEEITYKCKHLHDFKCHFWRAFDTPLVALARLIDPALCQAQGSFLFVELF